MFCVRLTIFAVYCLITSFAVGQEPVSVGRGSYASAPPKGKVMDGKRNVDLVKETEELPLYLVKDDGRPIPSNKWYQNLLLKQYGTGLWAMPHKIDATKEGIELYFPTKPDGGGTRMLTDFPLVITGQNFKPIDSRAKDWKDWLVSFRMFESEQAFFDVTLGEGMPYVWCEFTGVEPRLEWGGQGGKGSRGKNAPTFFDIKGAELKLPFQGDVLGIRYEERNYGVFAPDGTQFGLDDKGIAVNFTGDKKFLVLAPLPNKESIATFHDHAFAVPRNTQLTWKYDRQAGMLTTKWEIDTELLKGSNKNVLQGWLPHQWRDNASPLDFNGIQYTTIRGQLKCTAGRTFTLSYPFHGVLPNLPLPEQTTGLDRQRMHTYFQDHFLNEKKQLGADTYWGGKDLERFAQAAFMAKQLQDSAFDPIVKKTRETLENWLTYTPGEKERYFAYYPRRKGLIGFNTSFGSQHFTDHHFHNGYFVFTAGLLSQLQPEFAEQYGEMAKLVAKTYANYDRQDQRFPFLRTFDIWRGHSFADGKGFPDGNNQESTGEAINSWVGMILLGEALGDQELTAAGIMGYTFESRANVEYWFDPHNDIFPEAYPHKACGMIWCNSIVWGTWFTASPGWIYGIQWLPSGPFSAFYDRDPQFIKQTYSELFKELEAFEEREAAKKPGTSKKPATLKSQGGELGSYLLGFVMHADPKFVIDEIDKLYTESNDKVAHDPWMANIYYQAQILNSIGRVDWTCHGSTPTSMVYRDANDKQTYVAWNPTSQEQVVEFFSARKSFGKLRVAPYSLTSSPALMP